MAAVTIHSLFGAQDLHKVLDFQRFLTLIYIDCHCHQFSSVAQSCPALCNPMDCSTPGFPVLYQLPELAQTHVHWSVMPLNHLILCRPLLLLPSILPNIWVFSTESVLFITWPKYWSFGFSICPSSDFSGLISYRVDWVDLLVVQGTLKSLLQQHSSKKSIICAQLSSLSNSHIHTWPLEKP